jgi:hypothetical protein
VARRYRRGMQFIIALVLFVIVAGLIDRGLPWRKLGSQR